jgi:UDP-N-acetylmuramate dehydrogenase
MTGSRPGGLRERVALAPFTTLGVGGEARFFLDASSEDALAAALDWARRAGIPTFILGGGSNVLVADRGLDGLVLRVGVLGIKEVARSVGGARGAEVGIEVGAGERFDPFVERCVRAKLAGVECLSGIPGLVGATPIQNVGAYGQDVGERIVAVRTIDRATGAVTSLSKEACRFAYRSSIFKDELRDACIVSTVTFALSPGPAAPIRYAELARELEARGADPASLAAVRDAVIALRRSKSMVIDPADENRRSVGSFFVNPVVDRARADEVEELAPAAMPRFPAGDQVKLSAGWLIEQAGFSKGTSEGAAGLSTRHALAVVNRGGASAGDVLRFAARVRAAVRARFGIALVHEPVLLGFDEAELAELEA